MNSRPIVFNLDEELQCPIDFTVGCASENQSVQYLSYIFKGSLARGGTAVSFMRDNIRKKCLRVLICIPENSKFVINHRIDDFLVSRAPVYSDQPGYVWYESFPIPDEHADAILDLLFAALVTKPGELDGVLRYTINNEGLTATCRWNNHDPVYIFFSSTTPEFVLRQE